MALNRSMISQPPLGHHAARRHGAHGGSGGVSAGRSVRRRRQRRLSAGGVIGLGIIAVLVAVALFGPWLVTNDPTRQDLLGRLQPPVWQGGTWEHPLGTDGLGRDLLSRIIAGARVSLAVGLTATLVAGLIGVTLGLLAGAGRPLLDRLIGWIADVQLAIPFVLIGIAVASTLGPSLRNVIILLAITGWVTYARIVRMQARSLLAAPWIEAARSLGVPPARLRARHLLPNLLGPIVIVASQQVAAMILYEAALSYLGLGVPTETITWGRMVAEGREQLPVAWWISTLPGVALALTVLGGNLFGDCLSDWVR